MSQYELHHGDCLDILPTLEAGSVDAVITDPPYGITACKWDAVIPFEPMWVNISRVATSRRVVTCLFSQQPFTSMVVSSRLGWYRSEWIWEKNQATGHLNAKVHQLKAHENIIVFSEEAGGVYRPQKTNGHVVKKTIRRRMSSHYGSQRSSSYCSSERYPRSVLRFDTVANTQFVHPTQKPVALMEYLIKTYTSQGDTVLDFTMGSGTTGVAAMRTGRKFIGIELDPEYFAIAQNRIANAAGDFQLTQKEKARGQMSLFG